MIRKDIAEYEDSDSQLAKNTINKLNSEIIALKRDMERLIRENKALKFDKIQEYLNFHCIPYSEKNEEKYEEALKVCDNIRNIMRGGK